MFSYLYQWNCDEGTGIGCTAPRKPAGEATAHWQGDHSDCIGNLLCYSSNLNKTITEHNS